MLGHLFPGDFCEHAAVIAAGLATTGARTRLLARDAWIAKEPQDYRVGDHGHMGLQASFIHRCITQCRDERLVYLATHNHGGSGRVAFSEVDMASHQRGYRALLDIAAGMPVGALVVADAAIEADIWFPGGERSALRQARVLGSTIERYYPNRSVRSDVEGDARHVEKYARQILFLGSMGQALFERTKVAIVGLGGIGSLVVEYLARLGIGHLTLIDPDELETSNMSRVVGSRLNDVSSDATGHSTLKVDIAERVAREAHPSIRIEKIADDFAKDRVARRVLDCDFIFLAADTMRARLVFNAIVQQYYIPGVQLGTKVTVDAKTERIESAFSVVRNVRPGEGCLLCNQLIDPVRLAEEWKSDSEKDDQQYGARIANPSVITMNSVAAAHAVNDFLFSFTGILSQEKAPYRRYDHLTQSVIYEHPRQDSHCTECSGASMSRLGLGDARSLPTAQ